MEDLKSAYQTTKYRVFALPIVIQINEQCEALNDLLRSHQADEWAFITAWNPRSRLLPDEENNWRHAQLMESLKSFPVWEGEVVGADASWKPERSLLVLGISKSRAIETGLKFEQNAIVYGRSGQPAELLMLLD